MKRTIITIALCILAANVYAQEEQKSAKDRLSEIEGMADQIIPGKSKSSSDGIFKANALSHLYLGEHILDRNLFPGNRSHEVGLNILELSLAPAKWISFNVGCDIKWDRFISKGKLYEVDSNGQFALSAAPAPKNLKSKICAFGFSAPADIAFRFGKVGLKLGAEAVYDLDRCNKVKNKFRDDNGKKAKDIIYGGEIQNFRLAYFAVLDFDGDGAYIKYCPGTILPGSINLENLISVGLYFDI